MVQTEIGNKISSFFGGSGTDEIAKPNTEEPGSEDNKVNIN